MDAIRIRVGRKDDCAIMAKFLRELGNDVGQPCSRTAEVKELEENGFGDAPLFHTYIAEITNASGCKDIIGVLIYYHSFSMFRGRTLHVESIYVQSDYRNKGIGLSLMKQAAKVAFSDECANISLTANVLNTKAIKLYERLGFINQSKSLNVNLVWLRADQTAIERLATLD